MPGPAIALAGASLASGIMSSISNSAANAQNVALQRYINDKQLEFAKNAQSIAAADRMRAGLSPLDSAAAVTPNLTAPTVQPTTDGKFIQQAANDAFNFIETKRVNDATIAAANAKANADTATALNTLQETNEKIASMEDRIAIYKEQLQEHKNKNDEYSKSINTRLEQLQQTLENTKKSNAELQRLIDEKTYNTNWYKGLNLPTDWNFSTNGLSGLGVYFGVNAGKEKPKTDSDVLRENFTQWKKSVNDEINSVWNEIKSGQISRSQGEKILSVLEARRKMTFNEWKKKMQ